MVQQVVADGEGLDPVTYTCGSRTAGSRSRPARAADADITFWLDRATALAIHRGELSAQTAFLEGRLRVGGTCRPEALTGLGALAALDDVFAAARA